LWATESISKCTLTIPPYIFSDGKQRHGLLSVVTTSWSR
jgi:hypothetical protein